MDRRLTLAAYALGVVLIAAFVVAPFVAKKRDIPAEVPSPPPLTATDLVLVKGGQQLCMSDLAVSAESRQMRFKVGTYGKPGPPLTATIKAAGYSGRASVRAGFVDNSSLAVPIPPPRRSRSATVCIRNRGRHEIAFYAASDQSRSRVKVSVAGRRVVPTPTLSFAEAKPVSFEQRAGATAGRIAVFRGFLDHTWIVWLLAFAVLVGVPVLVAVGLAASAHQPRSDSSGE